VTHSPPDPAGLLLKLKNLGENPAEENAESKVSPKKENFQRGSILLSPKTVTGVEGLFSPKKNKHSSKLAVSPE